MPDHVHVFISSSKIASIFSYRFYRRQKCNLHCAKFFGKRRNFVGESFWARGFYVSTVGLEEAAVQDCIRKQEQEDQRVEQLQLM